ncbi:MAG: Pyrroline-5-carboxylate reductase [Candidatus Celerinatantimonas neptuna]|nr:MAG: Pyrroline-5-carboxylate reductase [Candidatus Celerinatantimonas neptuna]
MSQYHFIGAGQMAEAMLRAAIKRAGIEASCFSLSDIDEQRVAYLQSHYQLPSSITKEQAITQADYIVIGVRPQDDVASVCAEVCQLNQHATIISIIAGVTLETLSQLLGDKQPIARIIPNTLTDTGFGYSGVVLNEYVEKELMQPFLESFGKVMYLEERMLDIFTGFGVAGVNYVYYFIESLVDAGVLAGLPRPESKEVVYENLIGAVEMLKISGKHPRQLLDINNSPAGVGMHGLYELNHSDFAAGLQRSVLAAVKRTTELANE